MHAAVASNPPFVRKAGTLWTKRRGHARAMNKQKDGEIVGVLGVGAKWESGDSYYIFGAVTSLRTARISNFRRTNCSNDVSLSLR